LSGPQGFKSDERDVRGINLSIKAMRKGEQGIPQGLKPAAVAVRDAKAKALAYLEAKH
jgi:hypothetical protein